jgi:hypothetical protein
MTKTWIQLVACVLLWAPTSAMSADVAKGRTPCVKRCERTRTACVNTCKKTSPDDPDELRGCVRACGQDHNQCRTACETPRVPARRG